MSKLIPKESWENTMLFSSFSNYIKLFCSVSKNPFYSISGVVGAVEDLITMLESPELRKINIFDFLLSRFFYFTGFSHFLKKYVSKFCLSYSGRRSNTYKGVVVSEYGAAMLRMFFSFRAHNYFKTMSLRSSNNYTLAINDSFDSSNPFGFNDGAIILATNQYVVRDCFSPSSAVVKCLYSKNDGLSVLGNCYGTDAYSTAFLDGCYHSAEGFKLFNSLFSCAPNIVTPAVALVDGNVADVTSNAFQFSFREQSLQALNPSLMTFLCAVIPGYSDMVTVQFVGKLFSDPLSSYICAKRVISWLASSPLYPPILFVSNPVPMLGLDEESLTALPTRGTKHLLTVNHQYYVYDSVAKSFCTAGWDDLIEFNIEINLVDGMP